MSGCRACAMRNKATTNKQEAQEEPVVLEASNPGTVGYDTGYTFRSDRTGSLVRVVAKAGEPRDIAIARVRSRHTR